MSSWVLFVVWCVFFTITIQTVYTDHNDHVDVNVGTVTKPFVNFEKLGELIKLTPSIFIDGNDLKLEKLISNIDKKDRGLTKAFTLIKCELSDYLNGLMRVVSFLLTYCPTGERSHRDLTFAVARCHEAFQFLLELEKPISRAMTTLFEIVDRHRNLKSHEKYFQKTLLIALLYINHIKEYNHLIKKVENIWTYYSVPYDNNPDGLAIFIKIQRKILQISNLIRRFTIEYCDYSDLNNYIKGTREWNVMMGIPVRHDTLRRLNEFLNNVVSFDTDSPYSPISIDDIRLQKCITNSGSSQTAYDRFCLWLLKASSVDMQKIGDRYAALVNVPDFPQGSTTVDHRYDIKFIREYLLSIYKVIWKGILHETAERWKNDSQLSDVEGDERIISKLKSMRCPAEIVDHLEFVFKVQNYKKDGKITQSDVQDIGRMIGQAAVRIEDVQLSADLNLIERGLSLTDMINVIVSDEFKKLWWLLDSLRDESDTYSAHAAVLDYSLYLDVKNINKPSTNWKIKCEKLTDIYLNFFILDTIHDECSSSENKQTNCYRDIRRGYNLFLNMLLNLYNKWYTIDILKDDKELRNITLFAVIHLNNAFDADKKDANNNLKVLLSEKKALLKRRGDLIMNLLDNYRLRHCGDISSSDRIYENVRDGNHKIRPLQMVFELMSDMVLKSLEMFSKPPTEAINPSSQTIADNDRISADKSYIYSISQLTGNNVLNNLKTSAEGIRFYWHGEIKSIRDVQIDVSKNMLNIRDLVEYQNLFIRWVFYVFYRSWFFITNEIHNSNTKIKRVLEAYLKLNQYQSYYLYKKYAEFCQDKITFFNILCTKDAQCRGSRLADIANEEILNSMSNLLGIVDVNISNSESFTNEISQYNGKLLGQLRMYSQLLIERILLILDKQFIFLDVIKK